VFNFGAGPEASKADSGRLARRLCAGGISVVIHVLIGLVAVWVASKLSWSPPPGGDAAGWTVVIVHAPELAGTDAAHAKTREPTPGDLGIRVDDHVSTLALHGFTFDYSVVASRAGSLFPFLTGRLSLEHVVGGTDRYSTSGLANPFAHKKQSHSETPPLVLRDTARQALLDRTWSRRDRWHLFQPIATLAASYDPNTGDLPALLRAYVIQNGLQPYADTEIRDPRLWTQLGLASHHADFIDFISQYAGQHPSTKATTELLFLLDALVQGSFDALAVLLETKPETDLTWTRDTNRQAYDAVVKIRDYYRQEIDRRSLASPEALIAYYDAARLAILTTILETTPDRYRASDARFLIGAMHWKHGKREEALGWWRDLRIDADDHYVAAYSSILAAVSASDRQPVNTRQIDRILEAEHARWLSASYDRLRQFGFRFDTF
jgi:hypothetical protein